MTTERQLSDLPRPRVDYLSKTKEAKILRILTKLKFEPASINEQEALTKILDILGITR